jgi:hypothetical protein
MRYETDLEECKSRMFINSDLNLGIDDTGWLFSLSIMQVKYINASYTKLHYKKRNDLENINAYMSNKRLSNYVTTKIKYM